MNTAQPTFVERSRPATSAERDQFARGRDAPGRGQFFVFVALVLLSAIIVGVSTLCISVLIGAERWPVGLGLGCVGAIAVVVFIVRSLRRDQHRRAELESKDLDRGQVTELSVSNARWFSYSTTNSRTASAASYRRSLILIADLEDGERVCLSGDILFRPELYGCEAGTSAEVGGDAAGWNGLPAPYAFPSEEAVITYWPESRIVIGIEPTGPFVEPTDVVVQSLHAVGWNGEPLFRFQGDPQLSDARTNNPISLSMSPSA